jgi:hypothetical protein
MAISARNTKIQGAKVVRRRKPPAAAGQGLNKQFSTTGLLNWDRIVTHYGLTKSQLAETVGLRKDTLQKAARRDTAKTQARVTEMLEILNLLEPWAGGQRQALAWYRSQPIAALDGRTAEALVKSGHAGAVRDYVDHIALGGVA